MTENFKSFMQRMEALFPHPDCVKARVFYKLLKNEFRSFTRKSETNELGEPLRYFEHMRRVAILLIDEVGLVDFTTIMAALGHDAVEDTRMELEEVTLVCGEEVAKTIALCSKTPKNGFRQRLLYLGTWQALFVKIADRIDNLRTMGSDPEFREKTIKETKEMYIPLSLLLVKRSPDNFKDEAYRIKNILLDTLDDSGELNNALSRAKP